MTHAARRLAFGGEDVDEHLLEMLRSRCAHCCTDRGYTSWLTAAGMCSGINVDVATARSIKEKQGVVCEVRAPLHQQRHPVR